MYRLAFIGVIFLVLGYGMTQSSDFAEIAGGVAIFLFGMMALGEGFKAFTGGTLENILRRSTDRLWKSVTFGTVATTLTQSSSLVTLISVSFLSAGLMGLYQGIGVIFGANLGTTTGAWLIAGFGLRVNISAYAMPMLLFGIILIFTKSKAQVGLGYILAGIGMIFLGIHFMKEGFEAISQTIDLAAYAVPGTKGLLIYTGLGIVATVVMQSSHATLVLTIAALATGQVTYENALALAIGSNVGTTITAIMGAFSANIAGKRLAAAHLMFNVTVGALALLFIHQFLWAVQVIGDFIGLARDDYTLRLAVFHSLFNVVGLLVWLPFARWMADFLERKIKSKPVSAIQPKYIGKTALLTPDTGLEAARKEIHHVFDNSLEVIALALNTDPAKLRKGEELETLAEPPKKMKLIDVEDYYQRRVRPLQHDLLEFMTQLRTADGVQARQAFALRASNQYLVEAFRDLKLMQSNLVTAVNSSNEDLKKEYVEMRRHIALLLHELHQVLTAPGENPMVKMDELREGIERHDILNNGRLDRLVGKKKISPAMATQLMNDSYYAFEISKNLIAIAVTVYKPFDRTEHQLDEELHLSDDEIAGMAVAAARTGPMGFDK